MENEYSTLLSKYKEFMVPAAAIVVNDKNLTEDLGFTYQGLNISLDLANPSTASFQISDCYDPENTKVKSAITSNIKLGGKIEISLGYSSSKTKVFSGYVESMGLNYSAENGFNYQVSAVDVIRLMKQGKRLRLFDVDTYSEAFSQVMQSYSGLCSCEADSMDGELKVALKQESSDYDFIMKDLIEEGDPDYEFLVSLGKAYFRKKETGKKVVTELKPGAGLKSCNWSFRYVNCTITALGYADSWSTESFSATKDACADNLADGAVKYSEVLTLRAESADQVTDKAARRAADLLNGSKSGSITSIGLPELQPGKYIKISDLDPTVNGEYYMTGIKHSFGEDGFSSVITIGQPE